MTHPAPAVSSTASLVLEMWLSQPAERRRAILGFVVAIATVLALAAAAAVMVGSGVQQLAVGDAPPAPVATTAAGGWDPHAVALPAGE